MATKFKQGQTVMLVVDTPKGKVIALRMLEDGTVQCLMEWADADGNTHQRWFDEDSLTGA